MSHLVITDLHRAEALSASSLAQVAGGAMTCNQALGASNFYNALGEVYMAMGLTSDAAASFGRGRGQVEAACPA